MKPEAAYGRFEANQGGGFVVTWNWAAFLFGGLWYLVKGLWIKGLAILVVSLFSHGVAIPVLWLYAGVFGNWDEYLLRRCGSQLWTRAQLLTVIGAATGRTRRCPFCAEFIQEAANVCRYCGRDLPPAGSSTS